MEPNTSRRKFLSNAPIVGFAAGAGLVTFGSFTEKASAATLDEEKSLQYEEQDQQLTFRTWVNSSNKKRLQVSNQNGRPLYDSTMMNSRVTSNDVSSLDGLEIEITNLISGEVIFDDVDFLYGRNHEGHGRQLRFSRPPLPASVIHGNAELNRIYSDSTWGGIQIGVYGPNGEYVIIDRYVEGHWRRYEVPDGTNNLLATNLDGISRRIISLWRYGYVGAGTATTNSLGAAGVLLAGSITSKGAAAGGAVAGPLGALCAGVLVGGAQVAIIAYYLLQEWANLDAQLNGLQFYHPNR